MDPAQDEYVERLFAERVVMLARNARGDGLATSLVDGIAEVAGISSFAMGFDYSTILATMETT
jgi:hypothetical protein